MRYQGKSAVYQIEVVGLAQNAELARERYSIQTDRRIDELGKTDVILVTFIYLLYKWGDKREAGPTR